jgi:hypothetical protein
MMVPIFYEYPHEVRDYHQLPEYGDFLEDRFS